MNSQKRTHERAHVWHNPNAGVTPRGNREDTNSRTGNIEGKSQSPRQKHAIPSLGPPKSSYAAIRIAAVGVFLYLTLKPLYLWDSGLPQVADIVLVSTVALSLLCSRFASLYGEGFPAPSRHAILFAYYVSVVNLTAMLVTTGDIRFAFSSVFIVYNVVALIWLMRMLEGGARSIATSIAAGAITGVAIQLILVTTSGDFAGGRATGSFNNPNQLGYHGLLSAALLLASARRYPARATITAAGVAASSIIVAASLSKAAIVSMLVLILGIALFGIPGAGRTHNRIRLIVAAATTGGLAIAANFQSVRDLTLPQSIARRFAVTQSDDSLSSRGYSRLIDYPEYWLFGAGEGNYERFASPIEFHSLLGNVQVSYGIIGLILFVSIIGVAVRNSGIVGAYLVASVMFYGITHNGIRNTFLWLLIGLLASAAPRDHAKYHSSRRESADHPETSIIDRRS